MTKPAAKFRDGRLTATIWKNETTKQDTGEISQFYSVDIVRSYKDANDQWQETPSFTGADLLKVANLSTQAYNYILNLKSESRPDHG